MDDEIILLIKRTPVLTDEGLSVLDDAGRQKYAETRSEVFCRQHSIGQKEFYQAHGTDRHPEMKVVLRDYWDYDGEPLAEVDGVRYRIMRTYRTGLQLELTLERASEEDGESNGQVDQSC